jgi:hypothetical protein
MTVTVPRLSRPVYGVLGHHRQGGQALIEGCVAVVAVAPGDRAPLPLAFPPLVPASALSAAAVRPARRAVR